MLTYIVFDSSDFNFEEEWLADDGPAAVDGPAATVSICRSSTAVNVPGTFRFGLRFAEFVRNGGVGLNAGDDGDEL